jgi:homospermidine synthase
MTMTNYPIHINFPGRLIFIGFGSIGQGVLPLILRHIGITTDRITVLVDEDGAAVAASTAPLHQAYVDARELQRVLDPLVGRGDFLLNLSVDVSSVALVKLCNEKGALYLDTCIEPWPGGYRPDRPPSKKQPRCARKHCAVDAKLPGPTAVLTHSQPSCSATSGWRYHRRRRRRGSGTPETREAWGQLAHKLGVRSSTSPSATRR